MARRKSAEPPGRVPTSAEEANMAAGDYVIPPCDETKAIPKTAMCQEVTDFHGLILPCSQPAVAIVRHERDGRAYYLCLPCADHNVRNRGGVLVKIRRGVKLSSQVSVPVPVPVPAITVGMGNHLSGLLPDPLPVKKSEPDALMQFEDVVLIAQLENVPLLSYINQTLQATEQGRRIKENLDGLRKAIDDFLANSGASGFIFVDSMNDGRVFSFRRVETTRETLDAVLLMQNGVAADVIERSKRRATTTALTIREIKG